MKPRVTKNCLTCNKEFTVLYARRYKNFCSALCGYKEVSRRRKLNNPGGFKKRAIVGLTKANQKQYNALHRNWVKTNLGRPDKCEGCGKKGLRGHNIHWANISDKYKKDPKDWVRLCAKCHFDYDYAKYKIKAAVL